MSADRYLREMYTLLKYLPTWLPSARLRLGDVGLLHGRLFEPITSLDNLGIAFRRRVDRFPADIDAISQSGARLEVKAAGATPAAGSSLAQANAGVVIVFEEQGGFVFQASGCELTNIDDKATLARDILDAYNAGEWQDRWVVIESLVRAASASVLISDSDNSRVELSASGVGAMGGLPLASASTTFTVASQQGSVTKVVSGRGATPLFLASRVRWPFWRPFGAPEFGPATRDYPATSAEGRQDSASQPHLEAVTLDEYLAEAGTK